MRKVILITLLAVVSGSAMAEWVRIATTGSQTIYADTATIRKKDNRVKMWFLNDFQNIQTIQIGNKPVPFMSTMMQIECDCDEEKTRILFTSLHAKNMSKGGEVTKATDLNDWEPVQPGSGYEVAWQFACRKM